MNISGKYLAGALSAASLSTIAVVPAVAVAALPARATPDTVHSSCTSAWLRLWGTSGEHCYTGNGSLTVNLPGVNRAQVVGKHLACLSTGPARRDLCVNGPGTVLIQPPAEVIKIVISSG